jgi:hypothetical protein
MTTVCIGPSYPRLSPPPYTVDEGIGWTIRVRHLHGQAPSGSGSRHIATSGNSGYVIAVCSLQRQASQDNEINPLVKKWMRPRGAYYVALEGFRPTTTGDYRPLARVSRPRAQAAVVEEAPPSGGWA